MGRRCLCRRCHPRTKDRHQATRYPLDPTSGGTASSTTRRSVARPPSRPLSQSSDPGQRQTTSRYVPHVDSGANTNIATDAGVSKTTAARVFAIPELLEKILLELDLHTSEGLGFTNAANAIQLCRLEKVNRDFRETITGSKRLLGSREPLQVDKALLRRRRERKQRHEVSIECSRKESSRKVF